ncbi:MAG: hypothetical protein ACRD7E_16465 [Bryobacteraceae bacterium]
MFDFPVQLWNPQPLLGTLGEFRGQADQNWKPAFRGCPAGGGQPAGGGKFQGGDGRSFRNAVIFDLSQLMQSGTLCGLPCSYHEFWN